MTSYRSPFARSVERLAGFAGGFSFPRLDRPEPARVANCGFTNCGFTNCGFTSCGFTAFCVAVYCVATFWGAAGVPVVFAQARGDANVVAAFRAAPRELSLRLTRAKKAIEDEQYADAVAELGRLLAELDRAAAEGGEAAGAEAAGNDAPQDYFIGSRNEQGTHVSLKSEVQRLIGAMPAQGREWFELQFGPEARRMLNQAIESGDGGLLTSVSRRFFHTKAGYEATLLLGRYYMDQGQPLAAALVLRRLAESPAAGSFEPELSLLAATCWIQANQPQRAQTILGALAKTAAGAALQVGGKPLELPADERLARERLEALLALRIRDGGGPLAQWILYRGDAARTARVSADAPLRNPRWRVPTINNPNDERLAEKFAKDMSMQGVPPLPSLQPLAVNDFVLMRTAEGLLGVDVRTGKRVWPYPWDEADPARVVPANRNNMASRQRVSRETELKQRLFDDAAFGQISSDGDAVYFLHELPYASTNPQQIMMQMQVRGMNGRGPGAQGNQLVALDTRREGKFLWSIGDGKGAAGDDPRLADAFFLGPPLPVQGKLFVLMEMNAEVCVAAVDPKTGKLEWQQQLVQLESRTINVDANRRLAGSCPSFADGVLVCPTSAGAVVAVDIANRSLLWGFQYSQSSNEAPQNGVFFPRNVQFAQVKTLGQRWNDATVTIDDGRVLVTPIESNEMYCLDLLTGKLLWPAQKRNDLLFVAGVQRGKAVFVGKNNLVAVQMSDGKPAWANPLEIPEKALPSGRGVHAGAFYYLPTTAQQLLKIDLEAGKIVESIRTSEMLGNLICYRDEIISHGIGGLAVFPMVGPLRDRVANKLMNSPGDPWALGAMAELKAHAGEYGDAIALLREARAKNPDDQYLRGLLVQNLMNALRDDFAKYRNLADELDSLVDQPAEREKFLQLVARGLRSTGDAASAFEILMKLHDLAAQRRPDSTGSTEAVSARHAVRRDRLVAAELGVLYRDASDADRQRFDVAISDRRDAVLRLDNVPALRQFSSNFAFHPASRTVRLRLARKLTAAQSYLEAELVLAALERDPDPAIAGAAPAATAELLQASRQFELAANYHARLASQFASVPCLDGKSGKELADAFGAAADTKPAWDRAVNGWPYGKVVVEEKENNGLQNANYGRASFATFRETAGAFSPGTTLVFDQQKNYSLVCRDGLGNETFRSTLIRPDGGFSPYYFGVPQSIHARAIGQLVCVHMGTEVVAFSTIPSADKAEGGIRWRVETVTRLGDNDQNVRTRVRMNSSAWGGMRATVSDNADRPISPLGPVLANGVFVMKQSELMCLDPLSGEVIWNRLDMPAGSELFGDEELLIVAPLDGKEFIVLSAFDGREIARRPIAAGEQRWATNGRRVLAWTGGDGKRDVRLYDVLTGKTLYQGEFAAGSRGALFHDRVMAAVQPDGQMRMVSLIDGQLIADQKLDAEPSLNAIVFQETAEGYLLAVIGPPKTNMPVQTDVVGGSANSQMIHGKVYLFDRASGKPRWEVPATIEHFGLLMEQPTQSPLLVFMRKGGRNAQQSALLVLDKRDGRIVFQKEDVPVAANFSEVVAKPDMNKLLVTMGARNFEFTMTNMPAPPAPPAQVGAASSNLQMPGGSAAGILKSIFSSFSPAASVSRTRAQAARIAEAARDEAPAPGLPRELPPQQQKP